MEFKKWVNLSGSFMNAVLFIMIQRYEYNPAAVT